MTWSPCAHAKLDTGSVKLKEMQATTRITKLVEQTFEDIRDSRCPIGDRLSCCGERVYELVDA